MTVGVCNIVRVSVNGQSPLCGAPPPEPIPETPPKALVFALASAGVEVWNTETSPYMLDASLMGAYPGTDALAVGAGGDLLAIADISDTIYLWDTSTNPWTRLNDINAVSTPETMIVSAAGGLLFYGSTTNGETNYVLDMTDPNAPVSHAVGTDQLRTGQADFDQTESYLLFTRNGGSGNGFKVYDTSALPPTQITGYTAEGSTGFIACAIDSGKNYFAATFGGGADVYVWNLVSKAFLGIFDSSFIGTYTFSPNGEVFATYEGDGLDIFDSSNADEGLWSEIAVAEPQNFGSPLIRQQMKFNNTGGLLAFFQEAVAGDRRIVFDVTADPIERVPSFDTEGAAQTNGVAFVGDYT